MDREHVWPDLRAEWIVYEDDDLLVVNKPAGVPCQSADPSRPDDLVTRLRRHLAARSGARVTQYVGAHQRLDRDTSGLILYARRKEANAPLARQFEARTVDKIYAACVSGWPAQTGPRRLRHHLARGRDGRSVVVGVDHSDAREAVTQVRVMQRVGDRALLEARILTGRMHQVRAQLAHVGAPVAGDRLYGGERASRLMLHASILALSHPATGEPLRVDSILPPEMTRWLAGQGPPRAGSAELAELLWLAVERRWGLGRSADTTAFRLLHGEGEGLPGLAIDVYGEHLVVHISGDEDRAGREAVLDGIASLGFDGIYLKVHPRQPGRLSTEQLRALAPADPVRGVAAASEVSVLENGMRLLARLGDGLGTGLFLDQRGNRQRVWTMARGASVLNLFAHTGAFTVAAALGGALRTVSVDASGAALRRLERHLEHAGAVGDHRTVKADAFDVLARMRRAGERFDLVIVDPPTFSTTRASRFKSGADWVRLAMAAMAVTGPGGRLLACSNDQRLGLQGLRLHLHAAARAAGRRVAQMKDLVPPPDYPPPVGEEAHLKSVLITLAQDRDDPGPRRRPARPVRAKKNRRARRGA